MILPPFVITLKGFLSLYFFNLMITKLANKVIYIWRC